MKDALQFTIKTSAALITVLRSEGEHVDGIISLELSMSFDELAQLIGLTKCGHPYVVTFTPQEEP